MIKKLLILSMIFILCSNTIMVNAKEEPELIEQKTVKITGETPLGGASYYLDKYYNSDRCYSREDLELLANVMYHENHCNGEYIMYLTGCVVLNRVDSPRFPNTVKDVLYQKGQYATVPKFYTKEIPQYVYKIAASLLITRSTIPSNVIFQAMFKQGSGIYDKEHTVDVCGEYFCYE